MPTNDGVAVSSSYVVSPLDTVRLSLYVADQLQFTVENRISGDGSIIVPHLGNLTVGGMTLDDARKHLYTLYDRDYYVNPHIELVVLAYNPRFVTVIGQVNEQGQVPFPSEQPMYLIEAIARAGGWVSNDMANKRRVTIVREDESGETLEIEIDATDLGARDVPLADGDTIIVPRRIW